MMSLLYLRVNKDIKTFSSSKNFIFNKFAKNNLFIKCEVLFSFPIFSNPNIGSIYVVEHIYQSSPCFGINNDEKKSFFSCSNNNLFNSNIDFRDLCIRKGEIVQNIKFTILCNNKRSNFLSCILSSGFFFPMLTKRCYVNINYSKLNKIKIAVDKINLKNILVMSELKIAIFKKIFDTKNKNLKHENIGVLFYNKNKYYKKQIKNFIERLSYQFNLLKICLAIFLNKSNKIQEIIGRLMKLIL
nr:hypothetical protein Cry52Nrm3_p041 [Cryptomonas curvata]